MRNIRTWEAVKILSEDNTRRFKNQRGGTLYLTDNRAFNYSAGFSVDDTWELLPTEEEQEFIDILNKNIQYYSMEKDKVIEIVNSLYRE